MTKENSAATKTPGGDDQHDRDPSSSQAVSTRPRPSAERSRVRGDCQSRPWAGRGPSDSEDVCRETLQTALSRRHRTARVRGRITRARVLVEHEPVHERQQLRVVARRPPISSARHCVRSSTVSGSADQPSARSSSHVAQAALSPSTWSGVRSASSSGSGSVSTGASVGGSVGGSVSGGSVGGSCRRRVRRRAGLPGSRGRRYDGRGGRGGLGRPTPVLVDRSGCSIEAAQPHVRAAGLRRRLVGVVRRRQHAARHGASGDRQHPRGVRAAVVVAEQACR